MHDGSQTFNLTGPTRSELAQSDLIQYRLPGSKFFLAVDLGCTRVSGAAHDLMTGWRICYFLANHIIYTTLSKRCTYFFNSSFRFHSLCLNLGCGIFDCNVTARHLSPCVDHLVESILDSFLCL